MTFKRTLLAVSVIAMTGSLTACGGGGSDSSTPTTPTTPTEPTTPANSAPTSVGVSNQSVNENTFGAIVGSLTVEDPDADDTHTLSLESDVFTIDGTTLKLRDDVRLDADNGETSVDVAVTATDAAGETVTSTITVNINDILDRYTFDSQLNTDESAVAYTGQIARHALIQELNGFMKTGLQAELDSGAITTRQGVLDRLNSYFRTTEFQYPDLPITFLENAKQNLISEISGSHKDLVGKLAGNDPAGQHKNWLTGDFAGWNETGSTTPEGLVDTLFNQLADNAAAHLSGSVRTDFNGNPITKVYINDNGVDLQQLIQKFLLMGIGYSQGTDDYLGVDTEGKGLLTDNTQAQSAGRPYTNLEHQFDEGFGYFGAAVNYLEYTDVESAGKVTDTEGRAGWDGYHDTNGDNEIDLTSEYNWGQSVNASKRDLGSAANEAATDYTRQAMEAFIAGRKILNDNVGSELTTAQMAELEAQAEAAVDAWERSIVATVIHYINDTRSDLADIGTEGFSYADLAKHFSEMKGFALGIQFNERSQLSDADFATIHQLMGTQPVLTEGNIEAYRADLLEARNIIQAAYNFNAENVENW